MILFLKRSFVIRSFIFLLIFISLSGWYGSWIVKTKLLYPFYFYIYGNLGKVLLFSLITFAIITKNKIFSIPFRKYKKSNIIYLLIAAILTCIFPSIAQQLLTYNTFFDNIFLSISSHLIVTSIPILLALGIYGDSFILQFISKFYKELIPCFVTAFFSYFAIFYIWKLWPFFSGIVLKILLSVFSLSHKTVIYIPPRTLYVEKFAVTVDQACSGLESLLLFTGLCVFIAFIDRKKINFKKFVLFYIFGLVGTFLMNLLRVYMLIWIGLLFSPQLAANLFHTYIGMIFFLLFFTLLLYLGYDLVKKRD